MKELEFVMSDPDFWKDRAKVDAAIKELGEVNDVVKRFEEIERLAQEYGGDSPGGTDRPSAPAADGGLDSRPADSAKGGGEARRDPETSPTASRHLHESSLENLRRTLREFEIEELMKGRYDKEAAVMTISAGAGGQDAEDWAGMLYTMYQLFARRRGWKLGLIHESVSDFQSKTGRRPVKSVTFEIRGTYAYGFLKKEAGVHRLVRISPFSPEKKRHTSFALVEVLPDFQNIDDHALQIPESDLKFDFFRSSGPGGQNVNKVETAVRVTHVPTGIVIASQEERSQSRNRERAVKLLTAKLVKLMEEQRLGELSELRTRVKPEWGSQIRSYVLHPYQLVKDHRTNAQTPNAENVLEGDLDIFVESEVQAEMD